MVKKYKFETLIYIFLHFEGNFRNLKNQGPNFQFVGSPLKKATLLCDVSKL